MATATDAVSFANFAATTASFTLKGGCYLFSALGTWNSGSLSVEVLGPDAATYLIAATVANAAATLSANGVLAVVLAPGTYKLVVGGTPSALYANVARSGP